MFSIQTPLHAKGGYIRNAQSRKHTIRQAPTSPKERKTDKPDRPGYAGAMTQKERNKDGVLKHISEKSKKLGTFSLHARRSMRMRTYY
jgi:hypothetical protein